MKKTIQELVAECGLVPSDIVKLSDGRLSIGQASVWLRDFKLSMPAELLLEWYCRRKVEEGVGPLPVGRKKSVVAEIFRQKKEMTKEELEWCERNGNGFETGDGRENLSPEKLERIDHVSIRPKSPPTLIEQAKPYMDAAVDANIRLAKAIDATKTPAFTTDATKKVDLSEKKLPAKTKNMKKENPYLEERVIYEGPSTDSIADFIESASKMPVNPNTVFRDMEYGSIGDILPLTPSATPTGFASSRPNMTMMRAGSVVKLNANDKAYTIDFEKAKSGFLVDGKKYLLSDFKEV